MRRISRGRGFLLFVFFAVSALVACLFVLGWATSASNNIMGRRSLLPNGVIVYSNASDVILYKANVRFYGNGTSIDIDIGNSGTSDTQIVQVFMGTSASIIQNQITIPSLPVPLMTSSIVRITIGSMNLWSPKTTYYFRILTSSGQTLAWPEQAPNSY